MNSHEKNFLHWFCFNFAKIIKSSNRFWHELQIEENNTRVVWFGFICIFIGIGLEAFMQIILIETSQYAVLHDANLVNDLSGILKMAPEKFSIYFNEQLLLLKKQNVLILFFLLFIAYFFLHLFASAVHFLLHVFGFVSAKVAKPYDATLHIICFSMAPIIIAGIPLIGSWIATIWVLILLTRGLSQIYKLTLFQSLMTVLIPAFAIKMMWSVALSTLALAMPNPYFERSLLSVLKKGLAYLF